MRFAHILLGAASLLVATTAAHAADLLPIEHGTYVREGVDAVDPPFAAIFVYDGSSISGPHASDCTSELIAHDDDKYFVSTTCNALGDGSPAVPYTEHERVRVRSSTRVQFMHGDDVETYRRVTGS